MLGMNELTTLALAGHLVSPAEGGLFTCTITNQLDVPLDGYVVQQNARQVYRRTIPAGGSVSANPQDGAHWVFRSAPTGSFACVITFASGTTSYVIDDASLTAPNDIGPLPRPNSQMVVPCASQSVMVGCGRLPTENHCCREQFWSLIGKSYCLAVGESSVVNSTLTTGVQSTSSSEQTVSASVTGSAQAGWGPTSASISASLQGSNTVNQQLSVSAQTTRYISDKLENKGSSTAMVLMWQLRDIVYVYDRTGVQLASIDQSQNPIMIASPVDPGTLPPPPEAIANPPDIAAALDGTLVSGAEPPSDQWFSFTIVNQTLIPISFRQVFPRRHAGATVWAVGDAGDPTGPEQGRERWLRGREGADRQLGIGRVRDGAVPDGNRLVHGRRWCSRRAQQHRLAARSRQRADPDGLAVCDGRLGSAARRFDGHARAVLAP